MKRYNITVNGKAYDVAVEEINGASAPVVAPVTTPVVSAPVAPKPVVAPTPVAPTSAPTPTPVVAEGTKVESPMPGVIIDVKASVGDTVSSGQAIIVLEAMKMENDIVAPCSGKITSITVEKGDNVGSGQVIATIV